MAQALANHGTGGWGGQDQGPSSGTDPPPSGVLREVLAGGDLWRPAAEARYVDLGVFQEFSDISPGESQPAASGGGARGRRPRSSFL